MSGETYYLSSLESARFEPVRECRVARVLTFESGKAAIEVQLTPGVIGQDFNRSADIDRVILSCRHEDVQIDPVTEFPSFVFVAIPRRDGYVLQSPVRSDDLEIIGWGELYRTHDDAESHAFG